MLDIVVIAICAVLYGAEGREDDEFTPCFLPWTEARSERSVGEVVASRRQDATALL